MDASLEATTRWTERRPRDGQAGRLVALSRLYDAAPQTLWAAVVTPASIGRWFFHLYGDLKPGGRFRLRHNAEGEILDCDPARRLAVTWEYGGLLSWLTLTFVAEPSGARLTLEHEMVVTDEVWAPFGPGATGLGWDIALRHLQAFLDQGEALDPDQTAAWTRTDPGRDFCLAAAEAWRRAAVADGEDPATADQARANTAAFYTG